MQIVSHIEMHAQKNNQAYRKLNVFASSKKREKWHKNSQKWPINMTKNLPIAISAQPLTSYKRKANTFKIEKIFYTKKASRKREKSKNGGFWGVAPSLWELQKKISAQKKSLTHQLWNECNLKAPSLLCSTSKPVEKVKFRQIATSIIMNLKDSFKKKKKAYSSRESTVQI